MSEVLFWAATEFAIAGYMLKEIQKEKATVLEPNKTEEQQINS
jgi:hypothetical protein